MTKNELISLIRRQLGEPVFTAEITDEQISDNIDIAIKKFKRRAIGRAKIEGYWKLSLQLNVDEYDVPIDVEPITVKTGLGVTIYTLNLLLGPNIVDYFKRFDFVSIVMLRMWLGTINKMIPSRYRYFYSPLEKKITIVPKPPTSEDVLLKCYKIITDDNLLYDEIWVFEYALARSKYILGRMIRDKFQGIPGGGAVTQMNGDALANEGKEMMEKLEEELNNTYKYSRPPKPVMG